MKIATPPEVRAERWVDVLGQPGWFERVGQPLDEPERADAMRSVRFPGLGPLRIDAIADWPSAKRILTHHGWSRGWWEAEAQERRRLEAAASARVGEAELLGALSRLVERSSMLLDQSHAALERTGRQDAGLARAAAGSAAMALHQAALADLAEGCSDHPFAAKLRLFQAGRWPLCVTAGRFHIF